MAKKEKLKEDIKKISKTTKKERIKKDTAEKQSLWTKFRIFCHGVKSETLSVHWPSKKDMVKYSVATIVFIIFCAGFFYLIDVLFALIQLIFN